MCLEFLMQTMILICLLLWSLIDPTYNLTFVIGIGLVIAIASSTQDITVDALQEIVHRLNKSQKRQEFLWSHPAYTDGSNNQTSVAVIIQQDRARLMEL